MAEDIFGNRTVKYIQISNINPDLVIAPTINKVSNKVSALTGTAQPGTIVHIDANSVTYEVEALEDGTYTCTIDRLPAGSTITAYCTDAEGKMSKTVSTTVFKNGPDAPVVNEITNKSEKVTGYFTGSSATIVAIVGSAVYLPASDKGYHCLSCAY